MLTTIALLASLTFTLAAPRHPPSRMVSHEFLGDPYTAQNTLIKRSPSPAPRRLPAVATNDNASPFEVRRRLLKRSPLPWVSPFRMIGSAVSSFVDYSKRKNASKGHTGQRKRVRKEEMGYSFSSGRGYGR